MKFLLAEKREMTQTYAADGSVIPVTKVVAGPCIVTQVKTKERDGYAAVQLGFGTRKRVSKSLVGHFAGKGTFSNVREFQLEAGDADVKVGDTLNASIFAVGDVIDATGTSKGRGFQGVVKRWGFHGSPKTHGHKDQVRMPGASGAGGVQHVLKGKKMGGRMGGDRITVKNLEVVEVDPATNTLLVKGALPGAVGGLILIAGAGSLVIPVEAPAAVEVEATPEVAAESVVETPVEPAAEAAGESKEPEVQA